MNLLCDKKICNSQCCSKFSSMKKGAKHSEAAPMFDKIVFSKVGWVSIYCLFLCPIFTDFELPDFRIPSHSELFFQNQVKEALGGRVRLILSGAAPLATHVETFLRVVACCYVLQGYGMVTENPNVWLFFSLLFFHLPTGIRLLTFGSL